MSSAVWGPIAAAAVGSAVGAGANALLAPKAPKQEQILKKDMAIDNTKALDQTNEERRRRRGHASNLLAGDSMGGGNVATKTALGQ